MLHLTYTNRLSSTLRAQLHGVWIAAYTQEAALLGAIDFPPLRRASSGLLVAGEAAYLANLEGQLAGAVVFHQLPETPSVQIRALVVAPSMQRRGVARALVDAVARQHPSLTLEVSTGVANTPALALYRQFGFCETGRHVVGPESLEIVTLQRPGRDAVTSTKVLM